jgi:hypothetical protein
MSLTVIKIKMTAYFSTTLFERYKLRILLCYNEPLYTDI